MSLLTISSSSFCQVGYPRRIVIGADTLIAVTPRQVVEINATRVEMIGNRVLIEKQDSAIMACDSIVKYRFKEIESCSGALALERTKSNNLNDIILLKNNNIAQLEKKNLRQRIKDVCLGAGAGSVITVIFVAIIIF